MARPLSRFVVIGGFIGAGVGRRLLGEAVDDLERDGYRRVSLWVLAANGRARGFYRRAGFGDVSGASRMERVGAGRVEQVGMLRTPDAGVPG